IVGRGLAASVHCAAREIAMRVRVAKNTLAILTLAAAVGGVASGPATAQTLKAGQDRGTLGCGVSEGIAGFSAPTQNGNWAGFDIDFCRALAAAIFDDAGKVKFVPLSTDDRFRKLGASEVDVLSRNSSWTMSRESALGLLFAAVTYYDGQGFMVR